MSVDLGQKRTGIALCDELEVLAFPLDVIHENNLSVLASKLSTKAKENGVKLIVLGLPLNMDGSEGESCHNVYEFFNLLKLHTQIEIKFWDERKSTVTACNYLNTANIRGKKRKSIIDSVSAVVILENYLDYRRAIASR